MVRRGRTRKQRFQIALVLAGMSARQWCRDYYPKVSGGESVSHQHLSACLSETEPREMSQMLRAAIDRFIKEQRA